MKTFWILFFTAIYMVIGLGCWNILWVRHLRHQPGAVELMEDLPPEIRIVRVLAECIFWPVLICAGLWRVIYERKTDGK